MMRCPVDLTAVARRLHGVLHPCVLHKSGERNHLLMVFSGCVDCVERLVGLAACSFVLLYILYTIYMYVYIYIYIYIYGRAVVALSYWAGCYLAHCCRCTTNRWTRQMQKRHLFISHTVITLTVPPHGFSTSTPRKKVCCKIHVQASRVLRLVCRAVSAMPAAARNTVMHDTCPCRSWPSPPPRWRDDVCQRACERQRKQIQTPVRH